MTYRVNGQVVLHDVAAPGVVGGGGVIQTQLVVDSNGRCRSQTAFTESASAVAADNCQDPNNSSINNGGDNTDAC